MKIPRRKRWTIAIVGRLSGHTTSLDSLYKFRRFGDALAKATEMSRQSPNPNVVSYEVRKR